jgi:mitogen-activated protein kinase kinase kinase
MYASPEYINNIAVAAVDLWSLGCVVLEMATGHMPWVEYTGKLEFRIGRSSELGGPPLPSPDEAGPLCIDFLRQCFTIDHTQRPTASQLMQHEWLHAVVNVG